MVGGAYAGHVEDVLEIVLEARALRVLNLLQQGIPLGEAEYKHIGAPDLVLAHCHLYQLDVWKPTHRSAERSDKLADWLYGNSSHVVLSVLAAGPEEPIDVLVPLMLLAGDILNER